MFRFREKPKRRRNLSVSFWFVVFLLQPVFVLCLCRYAALSWGLGLASGVMLQSLLLVSVAFVSVRRVVCWRSMRCLRLLASSSVQCSNEKRLDSVDVCVFSSPLSPVALPFPMYVDFRPVASIYRSPISIGIRFQPPAFTGP